MYKKIAVSVIVIVLLCTGAGVAAYTLLGANQNEAPRIPTGELDITVSGSSNCLRFLNDSVPMVYVPFTVAANEQMQLTIEATKMPGGANGWSDIYLYRGCWDNGANNTCVSGDVYSILPDIEPTNEVVTQDKPYTAVFGESTLQSYTVFFVFPPGGPAEFHITLKPI